MADDKHYVPGDFYRICDRTGFKVRANQTRQQWDQLIVRKESWEPRQPQDFVRGVADEQIVPMPRPRQPNVTFRPTAVGSFQVMRYADTAAGTGTPATTSGCLYSQYAQWNAYNGPVDVSPSDL